MDFDVIYRDKTIGCEIDITIPKLNIGFEYNGILWHSFVFKRNRIKNKHKKKTELALSKGIKLYHIWEHYDESIIESKIKQILGKTENKYYARKLKIKEVGIKEQRTFLNENHLHGYASSSLCLGLYDGETLIQLMSFKKKSVGVVDLNRLCTLKNTTVVGGFSKLLKHSVARLKELGYSKIITFAYRDWTPNYEDSVYFKNGFKFIHYGQPSLSYFRDRKSVV